MSTELDRERTEELTVEVLLLIKENYLRGPASRNRCLEALNALAASAALVILGADGAGGEAHEFFLLALTQQLYISRDDNPGAES